MQQQSSSGLDGMRKAYTIDERLSMLVGYNPVPSFLQPGDQAVTASKPPSETPSRSLEECSAATKNRGDELLKSNKVAAAASYFQSQLFLLEHIDSMLKVDNHTEGSFGDELVSDVQARLTNIAKILKFIARLYTKAKCMREASAAHACCAVVQRIFVRLRWGHYDILSKELLRESTEFKDEFKDMMDGVTALFEAFRSWDNAKQCFQDPPLKEWAVISLTDTCRVVRMFLERGRTQ